MRWLKAILGCTFFVCYHLCSGQSFFLGEEKDYREENNLLAFKYQIFSPCGFRVITNTYGSNFFSFKSCYSLSDSLVQIFPYAIGNGLTKIYCQSAQEHQFYAEFDWVTLSKFSVVRSELKMETQLDLDSIQVEFAFGDVWGRKSKWSRPIWVKKEFTNQSLTLFLETLFDRKFWKDEVKINRLYFRIISKPEMPFWGNLMIKNIENL
jgi:hypothetical protein